MTDTVIRALTQSDAHLFDSLQDPRLVGRAAFGHRYATVHDGGEYRPEWTWVALRDGVVVARAAWWGGPEDTEPVLFNYFDFAEGEEEAAAELLRRAPWSAEYELIVPAGWRDAPEVRAAAGARIAAAEAAGMKLLVERYRYEWTPGDGLPERPGRLTFRQEPDDAVILEVLRRVHSVTPGRPCPACHRGPGRSGAGRPGGARLLQLVSLAALLVAAGVHPGRRDRRDPRSGTQSGRAVRRLHRRRARGARSRLRLRPARGDHARPGRRGRDVGRGRDRPGQHADGCRVRPGRSPHRAGAHPPGVSRPWPPGRQPVPAARWALITSRYQAYDCLGVRRKVS